jgi:CRP-like cAMP-binding protein
VSSSPERRLGPKAVSRDLSAAWQASDTRAPRQRRPQHPTLSELDRAMADIFRGFAKEETELLMARGRSVVCHSGQLALRAGDRGGEIFVVLEGSLMEMARQQGTESDTLAVYLRGDVLGEVPFAAAGVRKRSVIAMEETRLLALSVRTLNDLVLTTPRLAAKVFRNLAGIVATRFQHRMEFSADALVSLSVPLLRSISS